MAYTVTASTIKPVDVWGSLEVRIVTLAPAAADYATGGYAITPGTNVSLKTIIGVYLIGITGTGGWVPQWNTTTGKLVMYQQSAATGALTQCTAAEDLSATTFTLLVLGY